LQLLLSYRLLERLLFLPASRALLVHSSEQRYLDLLSLALAVTSTEVYGLDLSDGSLLWRATYLADGENHSNPLVVTGPDGFVVTGVNEAVAFRLERDGFDEAGL